MKKHFILVVFLCLYHLVNAQKFEEVDNQVFLGFDAGWGIFSPSDVNQYLKDYYSNVMFVSGFPEIVFNLAGNLSITYRVSPYFDAQLYTGLGWAPKTITVDDHTDHHNYTRFSYGIMPNIHIPLFINSLFFGAGPVISNLRFKSFQSNTVGLKFRGGYNIHAGRYLLKIFGGYDYIKGDADKSIDHRNIMNLSYSSIVFGSQIDLPLKKYK